MSEPIPSLPREHRAWAWSGGKASFGLHLEEQPLPKVPENAVLVANRAIGLNPVDWKILGADFMRDGHVPGVDGAGVVAAVGDGVSPEWLGRNVAYHQDLRFPHGSFAEYTPVAARALIRMPDALSFEDAAAFPCPGLTAWRALEKLPAAEGRSLLVWGAGGSVGHYLVQLAVSRGWHVTAACNARHWEHLQKLGVQACRAVGIIDPEPRFHAAIDTVGPESAAHLAGTLKANGHLVCIQGRVETWPCAPFGRSLSLHEVALGALHQYGDSDDWACLTLAGETVLNETASGRIVPEPHVPHGFDTLAQALDRLRTRNFTGKALVLL